MFTTINILNYNYRDLLQWTIHTFFSCDRLQEFHLTSRSK